MLCGLKDVICIVLSRSVSAYGIADIETNMTHLITAVIVFRYILSSQLLVDSAICAQLYKYTSYNIVKNSLNRIV